MIAALQALLAELVPNYLDRVCHDKDRSLAMTALHCIQEMLDSMGEPVLQVSADTFTDIVSAVKNVLKGKVTPLTPLLFIILLFFSIITVDSLK